jgi:hypothetical protein
MTVQVEAPVEETHEERARRNVALEVGAPVVAHPQGRFCGCAAKFPPALLTSTSLVPAPFTILAASATRLRRPRLIAPAASSSTARRRRR